MLGGILEDQTVKGWAGIPGLGQIPFFRYLFASEHTEKHENEIVFVLIPHIVRSQELTDLNARAIDVGTGTSIDLRRGSRPATLVPTNGAVQVPSTAPAQPAPVMPPASQSPAGAPGQPGNAPAQQTMPPGMTQPPAQPGPGTAQPTPATAAAQPNGAQAAPSSPPSPVSLGFDPATLTPAKGATFAVNVVLNGGQDVSMVPMQIVYNPKVMELVNISNGGFLSQDGQAVALVHRDDPASGTIQITATRPPGTPGVTGSGAVFTLTFLAKAPGISALTVNRPGLRTSTSQTIPATPSAAMVTVK
jgi:general secretion pathway protein D